MNLVSAFGVYIVGRVTLTIIYHYDVNLYVPLIIQHGDNKNSQIRLLFLIKHVYN